MNKIFMTTDWHFGIYPLELDKWLKMMLHYFYKKFIPDLKERYKDGDILIILGDVFDSRNAIPILVKYEVDKLIKALQEILPVYILVGNHDQWFKSSHNISVNSVHNLSWLNNVQIIDKGTVIDWKHLKIGMIPYMDKKIDLIKEMKNIDCDYLMVHSDLQGCRMHLNSVANKNDDKIEVEAFEKYKHVFSGHIHLRTNNSQKNFSFIGAPYHMDRNDLEDIKGMTILMEDGSVEFVENTVSPIFQKVKIKNELDIALLENVDTKNYVDLEINNSVLISNRKIRKKIESILETGKFAKVDYINDLVKESKSTDLPQINIQNIHSGKVSDFNDLIIEYLKTKQYGSDTVLDGVIKELDLVIKRFEDNKKINELNSF